MSRREPDVYATRHGSTIRLTGPRAHELANRLPDVTWSAGGLVVAADRADDVDAAAQSLRLLLVHTRGHRGRARDRSPSTTPTPTTEGPPA